MEVVLNSRPLAEPIDREEQAEARAYYNADRKNQLPKKPRSVDLVLVRQKRDNGQKPKRKERRVPQLRETQQRKYQRDADELNEDGAWCEKMWEEELEEAADEVTCFCGIDEMPETAHAYWPELYPYRKPPQRRHSSLLCW